MISFTKLWAIGSTLAALLFIAGAWFLGVSPQLDVISANQQQQAATVEQIKAGAVTLAELRADSKNLPSYTRRLQTLRSSVPASEETSTFLREINAHAQDDGVSITGVTFGAPVGYTAPGAAKTSSSSHASGGTTSGEGTPKPSTGSTAAPSAKASTSGTGGPATDPRITSTNFFSIPVSINVTGQRPDVLHFVGDMQHGARLYLVQSMTMSLNAAQGGTAPHGSGSHADTASSSGRTGTFTATIAGQVYMFQGGNAASPAR
jgi:Tfp pilus assembly protein PilO